MASVVAAINNIMNMKTDKKSVLLVEDNKLVFSIYQTWLRRYGFRVEGASDGEIALQKLPSFRPDVVVLDYMMPKLNGLGVLKFIRAHAELKATPVLVLSNAFINEEALKLLSDGTSRQLLKTHCTPKLLVQSIRELLGLVPPPDWESAALPPPGNEEEPVGEKPLIGADGRGNRKYFARIREGSLSFAKEADSPAGADHLKNLYQHVQFVSARAGLEGSVGIAHLTGALEALLLEVSLKKLPPPRSVLQTITQAVDCLGGLFDKGRPNPAAINPATKALIVEDNPICSVAAMTAMKRAKFEATSTRDPHSALEMARLRRFDVFLLDVNLPGMDGFQLCKELRQLPQYKKTPVIFVTSTSDFQKRAQAVLSGGNDLIAKPFWPQELALKTIMRLSESSEPPADKTPARTTAHPAAAPASLEKAGALRIGKLVMAKQELPATATNGNTAKMPPGRMGSAGGLKHHQKFPENRHGDSPFDKVTRDIARIEAAPMSRIIPAGNGGSHAKPAKHWSEDKPLDKIIRKITCILFGEDMVTSMSAQLTRIALENYRVPEVINHTLDEGARSNGSPVVGDYDELFDQITREVAKVIYDTEEVTERHLHLTRIALERHRVPEIIHPDSTSNGRANSAKSATDELESIRKDLRDIKATLTNARNPRNAPA